MRVMVKRHESKVSSDVDIAGFVPTPVSLTLPTPLL